LLSRFHVRTHVRRLRVIETVSLGEKRFISIVEVDGERLLIGGGGEGVRLLKSLGQEGEMLTVNGGRQPLGGLCEPGSLTPSNFGRRKSDSMGSAE
jgi:hypothetical protein